METSLQLVDRRKILGLFRCFCVICSNHLKIHSYSTTAPFWNIPKGKCGEGKFSQWAECQAVNLFILFILLGKKKGPDVWLYTDSCIGCGQWFCWMVRYWKEHDWKIGDKEIWGRWMNEKCEGICISCECSPKYVLSRRGF